MNFKKVTIADRDIIEKYLDEENRRLCEYCFTDIYMWRKLYNTEFCIEEGILYIRQHLNSDKDCYHYYAPMPSATKLIEGINTIILDSIREDYVFSIGGVSLEVLAKVGKEFPRAFHANIHRDYSNYIYDASDLINLSGRKFHKKKNLVNKFKNEYEGRWQYKDMSASDKEDILKFNRRWIRKNHVKGLEDIVAEHDAIEEALEHFDELELVGGILLVDGKIVAYTIATKMKEDMYVVQIEKAFHEYNGVYQMINHEFAKANYGDVNYVNREDDVGIEGLRKAKMSYNPVMLEDYYEIVLKKKIDCITIFDINEGMCVYERV